MRNKITNIFVGVLMLSASLYIIQVSVERYLSIDLMGGGNTIAYVDIVFLNEGWKKDYFGVVPEEMLENVNKEYFLPYGIEMKLNKHYSKVDNLRKLSNVDLFDYQKEYYQSGRLTILVVEEDFLEGLVGFGWDGVAIVDSGYVKTSTLAHEIGHSLFLSHRDDTDNIMSTPFRKSREFFDILQVEQMKKIISLSNYGKR